MVKLFKNFFLILGTLFFLNTSLIAGLFNHQSFTLPNGLVVYFIENKLAPIISFNIYYKVGTADDPDTEHGLSHFLEHMMFKGTKNVSKDQLNTLILQQGGRYNAYTTHDFTAYTTTIAKDQLPLLMFLEADRMENLIFTKEEVESERNVVLNERLMRLDNHPMGKAHEVYLRSFYWRHPYGIPPIGYPEHIKAYSYDSVRAHYDTYYAPNNAVVVICGDADFAEIKKLAQRYFGFIPASTHIPKRARTVEPDHENMTIELNDTQKRVEHTHVIMAYDAPYFKSEHKELAIPLYVLAHILTGNDISRWHEKFVEEEQSLADIHCSYNDASFDPRSFEISYVLHDETNPMEAREKVNQAIQVLLEKGITQEELDLAKRDILSSFAFSRDGLEGIMTSFEEVIYDYPMDHIEDFDKVIQKITVENVNAAARFVLSKKPRVVLTVSPENAAKQVEEKETTLLGWEYYFTKIASFFRLTFNAFS